MIVATTFGSIETKTEVFCGTSITAADIAEEVVADAVEAAEDRTTPVEVAADTSVERLTTTDPVRTWFAVAVEITVLSDVSDDTTTEREALSD